MSVADEIRGFIVGELRWNGRQEDLAGDYPLVENHVIDSLGLFTLVTFVEERFGVRIAEEELLPENFGTIDAIVHLVERKRPDASPGGAGQPA